MKKLPIGRDNFKDIIEGDFYYVDKTQIIEELLKRGAYVALFPRPRRFGKSLMISTLDEFFNIEKKEKNKNLFKGLNIAKSQYKKEQGKYPVINLNFKSLKSNDWEHMYEIIKDRIAMEYQNKKYILDSLDNEEKEFYYRIVRQEAKISEYEASIEKLSKFLERFYDEKVLLLIDEYDVPIQTGYTRGFYDDVIGFIKNLFGNALKTNNSIKFAVMTGILRVSKESIFSDLNNVSVYTSVDTLYDEYFGFNEKETSDLLKHFGFELTQDVKNMYDGYIFGGQEIYNPWSILNYAERGDLYPYWINTSADELLRQLFDKAKEEGTEIIEKLILGENIEIQYNEKVTFLDLKAIQSQNAKNLIGNFLLFTGYLTKASKKGVKPNGNIELKIPNMEIRKVYTDIISTWTMYKANIADYRFTDLENYIVDNDKENIEKLLNQVLQSMSFMDEHENFYHGYMLGLFVNFFTYENIIKSNREAGKGRFDLMIERVDRKLGIIVEFKLAKEGEDLERVAQKGKKQIEEKEYYKELEHDRVEKILTFAVAFRGKNCKVV